MSKYESAPLYSAEEWAWAPTIIRLDDNISVGEAFGIYGEGFDETSEVYVLAITSDTIPQTPPANAVKCEVLDVASQYMTVKLNSDLDCGSYNLWVSNRYGMSLASGLNVTRPQWVSDDVLANGTEFSIYGKNLCSNEFGGTSKSGVSLVDDNGNAYDIPVVSVNPYEIKCQMNDVPVGEYKVYVSNDGYIWNECEDKRYVTVIEEVYDPYEIGATMAYKYDFENIINLNEWPYLVKKGDNITSKLQAAINAVSKMGGGVIYIPKGTYYISSVTMAGGVVIAGAGKGKTNLSYIGGASCIFNESNSSVTGLANLSIVIPDDVVLPDIAVMIGDGFAGNYMSERIAEYGFLKNVSLTGNMENNSSTQAIGVILGGKSHFMVDGCDFKGYNMNVTSSYVNEYVKVTNCTFETATGNNAVVTERFVFENNYITRAPADYYNESNAQGVFLRGYAYVANNKFMTLGNPNAENDGEIICTENFRGGAKLDGYIASATENTAILNVTGLSDWTLDAIYHGKQYLIITDGRGLGQYSRILDFDAETQSVTLEKSFKILPDTTSRFLVAPMSENTTMYNNYCENTEKGYWLYNDDIDCVIANNIGINTEGIYARSLYKDHNNDIRHSIQYFATFEDNYFVGGSTKSGVCGIGVAAVNEGSAPAMTYAYGTVIKDNYIHNTAEATGEGWEAPELNGIYIVAQPWVKRQTKEATMIRQAIVENNIVSGCDRGLTVGSYAEETRTNYAICDLTDGVYVGENSFENTENGFVDTRNYVYGK